MQIRVFAAALIVCVSVLGARPAIVDPPQPAERVGTRGLGGSPVPRP